MHARDHVHDEPARRSRPQRGDAAAPGLASAIGNRAVQRLIGAGALSGAGGLDVALARAMRKAGPGDEEPLARGPAGPPAETELEPAGGSD